MSRCFLLATLALAAGCATANPYERTLANGLRVIVKEANRAPTVAHLVRDRGGSMDEVDGGWLVEFPRAVERVAVDDVRAAFARHVRPERLVTVVVGGQAGE